MRRRAVAAVGWSILFLFLSFLLAAAITFGVSVAVAGTVEGGLAWLRTVGARSLLLQGVAGLAAAALLTWLIGVRANRLTTADLRYAPPREAVRGFGRGMLVGGLAAGAALLLAVLLGSAIWVPEGGGVGAYAGELGRTLAILAPAALVEEVLFRGVPLILLALAFGRTPAIVATSALFGLAHLQNPSVTPLAILNIFAAGIFLALAFYAPGGIWTAFGAHLGWNGTLAALDAPVSGLPFRIPLIDYDSGGPAWLTGGAFGPEGGLTATIALALACIVTVRYSGKERQ